MRPVRAFFGICLLSGTWLVARTPEMLAEIEHFRSAVHPHTPTMPTPRFALVRPPPVALALSTDPTAHDRRTDGWAVSVHAPANPIGPRIDRPDRESVFTVSSPGAPAPRHQPRSNGYGTATYAYAMLASGDRRAAAIAFRRALAQGGDPEQVVAWRAQLGLMKRRWSGGAYVFLRDSSPTGLAIRPQLGGGQLGAQLGYALDPLARRPLILTARLAAATEKRSIDTDSAQAALGLGWRPLPDVPVTLAAERLVGVGSAARDAWTLRIAGGADRGRPPGAARWVEAAAYAEAGVVGANRRDLYASAIARAGYGIGVADALTLVSGAGAWASVQRTDTTLHRVDVGPSAKLRWTTPPVPVDLSLDWRFRVSGDARPESGPALTLSTQF